MEKDMISNAEYGKIIEKLRKAGKIDDINRIMTRSYRQRTKRVYDVIEVLQGLPNKEQQVLGAYVLHQYSRRVSGRILGERKMYELRKQGAEGEIQANETYWLFDDETCEFFEIEGDREPKQLNISGDQGKVLAKLIANQNNTVDYDTLVECYREDPPNDCAKALQQIMSKVKDRAPKLRTLFKNCSGRGYQFTGEKRNLTVKSEEELTADFESGLLDWEKKMIQDTIVRLNYADDKIAEEILPACVIGGKTYKNLYAGLKFYFKNHISYRYMIKGSGGCGKTSSLLHLCQEASKRKENDVIAIYVPVRALNASAEQPLTDYIFANYPQMLDSHGVKDQKTTFLRNLKTYFGKEKQKLLLVVDGCNENSEGVVKDLDSLTDIPNSIVIVSSRVAIPGTGNFESIDLNALGGDVVQKYLKANGIALVENYDTGMLELPIFLTMFTEVCKRKNIHHPGMNLNSQSGIIREWVDGQKKPGDGRNYDFTLQYLLPLISVFNYFNQGMDGHRDMHLTQDEIMDAFDEIDELMEMKSFQLRLAVAEGIDKKQLQEMEIEGLFKSIPVDRLAFIEQAGNVQYGFTWAHECYRDWFTAKGLFVLRSFAPSVFQKKMEIFLRDNFPAQNVFREGKDYPTFSDAVFLTEMIGEEELYTTEDMQLHLLIQNIIYYADELGDASIVLKYGEIIRRRGFSPLADKNFFEISSSLSGAAFCYLHLYNLKKRSDREQITRDAEDMLALAKKRVEKKLNFKLEEAAYKEDLMDLEPLDMEELLSDPDKIITMSPEYTPEEMERDVDKKTIPLLGRIYGNLGAANLVRFYKAGNQEVLREGHRLHVIGLAIKYYQLKHADSKDKNDKVLKQYIGISYRSLATDQYYAKNYERAIRFYEFAEKYMYAMDKKMVTRAYRLRSVVSLWKEDTAVTVKEIAEEMKGYLQFFEEKRMHGEIRRITDILYDLVDFYWSADASRREITGNEEEILKALCEHLDHVYERNRIANDHKIDAVTYFLEKNRKDHLDETLLI